VVPNQLLLFNNDLFQRPTLVHPSLKVLLHLLIPHLPTLDFSPNSADLTIHGGHFQLKRIALNFRGSLDESLEGELATPGLLELFFHPQMYVGDWLRLHELLFHLGSLNVL